MGIRCLLVNICMVCLWMLGRWLGVMSGGGKIEEMEKWVIYWWGVIGGLGSWKMWGWLECGGGG